MRYRKLDDNHDMVFGGGDSDFYTDVPEAVAQAVQTRLLFNQGESFLDMNDGTAWGGDVLGHGTQNRRDKEIRARISDTPGVTAIDSYASTLDHETRKLNVEATISTEYGEIKLTEAM